MTKKQKEVYLKLAQAVEEGLEEGLELTRMGFGDGVTSGCPLTMVARNRHDFRPAFLGPSCDSLLISKAEGWDIIAGFDGVTMKQYCGPYYEVGERLRQTYFETA